MAGPQTQQRLERIEAYSTVRQDIHRWEEPVKQLKEKRTVRFGDDADYKATLPTIATLSTDLEPTTDLEKAVSAATLQESHVKQYEELVQKTLTKDGNDPFFFAFHRDFLTH